MAWAGKRRSALSLPPNEALNAGHPSHPSKASETLAPGVVVAVAGKLDGPSPALMVALDAATRYVYVASVATPASRKVVPLVANVVVVPSGAVRRTGEPVALVAAFR